MPPHICVVKQCAPGTAKVDEAKKKKTKCTKAFETIVQQCDSRTIYEKENKEKVEIYEREVRIEIDNKDTT